MGGKRKRKMSQGQITRLYGLNNSYKKYFREIRKKAKEKGGNEGELDEQQL